MKRKLLAIVMCASMLFAACSEADSEGEGKLNSFASQTTTSSAAEPSSLAQGDGRQLMTMETRSDEMPEVVKVELSGKCTDEIERHAEINDVSGHVLHRGVVGRIGIPIEVKYDGLTDGQIVFYYDKSQLRGIPEKNLILLYCTAENEPYNTVESAKTDTEKCVVSASLQGQGVYLLADAYQWYSAWGMDASEYAYEADKTSFDTDWEREFDTGSIMQLADKNWAKQNAPDFHVSNAQQLASAVYYVNGLNAAYGKVSITLENDIDLTGYDWRPMGWNKATNHSFNGTIDGKGHTIKGMKINLGYDPCGFVGYGWDMYMHDIKFVGAEVSGTHSTGIACGEAYGDVTITNVSVQGTVSGGGNDFGAIIGREGGLAFKGCSADITVDGKPFKYFSFKQKQKAETKVTEYFHITRRPDGVIVRNEYKDMDCSWIIEIDGAEVLMRSTKDPNTGEPLLELPLDIQLRSGTSGKHTIYLVSYINDGYVRVSNIIEYEGTGL